MWKIFLSISLLALTGCAGSRGWQVYIGANPVVETQTNQRLVQQVDDSKKVLR